MPAGSVAEPLAGDEPRRRWLPLGIGAGVVVIALAALLTVGRGFLPGGSSSPTAVPTRPAAPTTGLAAATAAPSPVAASQPSAVPTVPPVATAPPSGASPGDTPAQHLTNAINALGRRDWKTALDEANAGLKQDPKHAGLAKAGVQARLGLGEQIWGQGNERDALTQFLAVREPPLLAAASPTELREAQLSTSYIWGDLMWSTDPATAVVEYGKVFRLDQGFRDIRKKYYDSNITLAKGALSRGDRIGAQRNLNAAREADPNGPELNDLFKSLTPTPQGTPGR